MLDRTAILRLIPHQGAMCLLDAALDWDAVRIRCRAASHRAPDNPLRRRAAVSAVAGIEYGLQAAALHGALTAGAAEPPRWLAALRDVELHVATIEATNDLNVLAMMERRDGDALIYRFEIVGDTLLVEGRAIVAGLLAEA